MSKILAFPVAAFLVIGICMTGIARADWPAKVFAPYTYVTSAGDTQMANCYNTLGQKYYTLAFMNSRDGQPYWEGIGPVSERPNLDQINFIRSKGGDVIMSFGGQAANNGARKTEMAAAEIDPVKLQAMYQQVIDAYKFTHVDQDIEGDNLLDTAVNERRNTALAALQKANPGLVVDYTLPCEPGGISDGSVHLLKDAYAKGLRVGVVNIMAMDYLPNLGANKMGKTMGELAVMAANSTYKQCQAIDPDIKVGLCSNTGQNDDRAEVFTVPDAKMVLAFAKQTPWLTLLTFWELRRDMGGGRGRGGGNFAAGAATRRGGRRGGGRRGSPTTNPSNLAVSGIGIPPAQPMEYSNLYKTFTTGFTPAQPQ